MGVNLGKAEVVSSILTGSTIFRFKALPALGERIAFKP